MCRSHKDSISNFRKHPSSISVEENQTDPEYNHYAKIVSIIDDNNYDTVEKKIQEFYIFEVRSKLQ